MHPWQQHLNVSGVHCADFYMQQLGREENAADGCLLCSPPKRVVWLTVNGMTLNLIVVLLNLCIQQLVCQQTEAHSNEMMQTSDSPAKARR